MHRTASPCTGPSSHPSRDTSQDPAHPGLARWCAPLALASLALLAACGGGEGADSAARTGVSIDKPLSSSALALAPGEEVRYEVECSGNGAMRYRWDAGDGRAQVENTSPTFTTTYPEPGNYLPRVTCIDSREGQAISAADVYQHVAVPAHTVSGVQAVPVDGSPGEFTLSASCVDSKGNQGGSALNYHWDFGDGQTGTGANVTHRYPSSPTTQYTARVRCLEAITLPKNSGGSVQTSWGTEGRTTVVVDVASRRPELLKPLSADPYTPTTAGPTTFSMECRATNSGTVSYSFDFGDGTPVVSGSASSATHTYEPKGQEVATQYTVKAACQQGGGWSQAQELRVGVRVPRLSLLAGKVRDPATRLVSPSNVAVDIDGHVYVANNHVIRKISPSGVVSTLAGSGVAGFADGSGATASFNHPADVAVDGSGHVYVADSGNHAIRKISPSGVVSTLAGSGAAGFADGMGAAASLRNPNGVAVDSSGHVYVADFGNHAIRKISPSGVMSTLAGSGAAGFADGTGTATSFNHPNSVAVDSSGHVYVADAFNHTIRKISPGRVVSTLAGSGAEGFADGAGTVASFREPRGVVVDSSGHVYVADSLNHAIRKISPSGVVSTLAGGTYGFADGAGRVASFSNPAGVAVDSSGHAYVADMENHTIRKISPSGVVSTLAGGTYGFADGAGAAASFNWPDGVAVDGSGHVYVADRKNRAIRKISPGGMVRTLAGGSYGFADGTGAAASFSGPSGVAVDGSGHVYVADEYNNVIRKISPSGVVSTLAGSGARGFADGTGAAASFSWPSGVSVDSDGHVYVADTYNHVVRKISPSGVVSTFAGSGSRGSADGAGTAASFNWPSGVAVDSSGHVYVADAGNHVIRKISPTGLVSTLAGRGVTGGFADGTGTAASFNSPTGVAVDSSGHVYVADYNNQTIRKISPSGVVSTVVGMPGTGLREGALPGGVGSPVGIAIAGRRLVFSTGDTVAQIDFVP
jgi:sugar lactone lactonase YvrE